MPVWLGIGLELRVVVRVGLRVAVLLREGVG